jgi:hypothetical protein
MTVTYCGMTVLTAGLVLLNVGYFLWWFIRPGMVMSSIGFVILMFAAGLSQFTGTDDLILYSWDGCTDSIVSCAMHPQQTVQKKVSPTS